MTDVVARNLNSIKKAGGRILAVGTTSVRVLESSFSGNMFQSQIDETDLFIVPGKYKWTAVDCLITNFHLPKSTLLMLVSSFLEHRGALNPVQKLMELYETAKKHNYRFYSFGDAMMII